MVGSIRYVKQALISSGEGWLDADPEIRRLKPDIYAVNEDGDQRRQTRILRKARHRIPRAQAHACTGSTAAGRTAPICAVLEFVASLGGIAIDRFSVLRYFSGANFTKEGEAGSRAT